MSKVHEGAAADGSNVMPRAPERLQIPEIESPGFFCGPLDARALV